MLATGLNVAYLGSDEGKCCFLLCKCHAIVVAPLL
jgi:hypothetical protein